MDPSLRALLEDGRADVLLATLAPWARAGAHVLPTATLVPALALRGTPAPLRILLAVALSAPIAAAFPWSPADGPLPLVLVADAIAGVPLAVLFATPLWIAHHVGALADQLRGAPEANQAPPPSAEGARGPLAIMAALLASSAWLASGGASRALSLLASSRRAVPVGIATWALAARTLADGIRWSFALSSGVLVAAVALEAGLVAIGRVAQPIPVQPVAMVTRPLVAVVALALSIELAIRALVVTGP